MHCGKMSSLFWVYKPPPLPAVLVTKRNSRSLLESTAGVNTLVVSHISLEIYVKEAQIDLMDSLKIQLNLFLIFACFTVIKP